MNITELGVLIIIVGFCLLFLIVLLFVLLCIASDLDTIKRIVKKEKNDESNNDEY